MKFRYMLSSFASLALVHATPSSHLERGSDDGLSDVTLASLITQQRQYIHDPEIFEHAVRILNSLESAPSCHRLAARALLDSCQALETPHENEFNGSFDQIKSVFAARLAVCELQGAHASIPSQCISMIPKPVQGERKWKCFLRGSNCNNVASGKETSSFKFSETSSEYTSQCLNALESRPQWWTSYSNARQNAVVICHAARAEVEKENLIEVHRAMTGVSSEVAQTLLRSTSKSNEILQMQDEFSKQIKRFQMNLDQELEDGRKSWKKMLKQAETDVMGLFRRVSNYIGEANTGIQGLQSGINLTANEVEKLQSAVKDSARAIDLQHQAFKRTQVAEQRTIHQSTKQLQHALAELKSKDVETLEASLQQIQSMIYVQTQMLQTLFQKQGFMDGKMDDINKSLGQVEIRASTAQRTLQAHADALEILFQNLTSSMETSNILAVTLNTSLVDAKTSLDSSISRLLRFFGSNSSFYLVLSITSTILAYCWFGVGAIYRSVLAGFIFSCVSLTVDQLRHSQVFQYISDSNNWIILIYGPFALIFVSAVYYAFRTRKFQRETSFEHGKLFPTLLWSNNSGLSRLTLDST